MKASIVACVAGLALTTSALAAEQEAKPAGSSQAAAMDVTKMGPGARKPANAEKTRAEIKAFFAEEEKLAKKMDFEGMLSRIDFPVYMATDDLKGVPEAKEFTREEYVAIMKPFWENMPKDMKMTHKPNITVLSDSLAAVIDDFTITMGKQKVSGKNLSFLVKRDGQWKWKMMAEAGWGGMAAGTGGSAASSSQKK
jgi:hypothetical protein